MTGNNVHDNGDNGMGLTGMGGAVGPNLIANNIITNNGRYGIEVEMPDGNGTDTGGRQRGGGGQHGELHGQPRDEQPRSRRRQRGGRAPVCFHQVYDGDVAYTGTTVVATRRQLSGYQQQDPGT